MAEKPAAKKEEKEEEEEGVTFGRKKTGKADVDREHPFWDHQPMLRLSEKNIAENTYIEAPKDPVKDIRQTPLDLLKEFEWCDTDIDDPVVAKEIYDLLNQNYVEDDDNMFRFDYSIDFLRWALKPPGFRKNWHIGVRVVKTKKLVAFISAIPVIMRVYDKTMPMVEINFLCVHKKLRKHRLAPVLISEITRRVNVTNVWQAVYTAGVVLPRPVTRSRYWHRSLNPLKLVDVGFSHLGPRLTKARMTRLYRLPDAPLTPGLRPLTTADVPVCHKLLEEYLKKFDLVPLITVEEFAHWIVPRTDVIYSWVVEDAATKTVTDFVSFYSLPSTIIGNTKYSTLKAAYAYYNVATKTPLKVIMNDALILAKAAGFDVFNCLDIMENSTFLKELKFGIGDGNLQYYLYNWKCPDMPPSKLGLVLMTQFAPSFQLCFRSLTMLTNTTTERAGRRDGQRARRLAMQPSPGSRATSPNKTGGAASGPMNEEEKRFFDKYGVLPPRSRPNKPYPHGDSTGYQEPTSAALKSFIAQQKAKRRSLLLQALVLLYHDRKRQPPSTALISTLPSDLLVRCIILLKAMSTFLWDHLTEVETRMRERRSLKIAQLRTNVSDLSLIQLRFIEAPRPQGSPRSDGDASSEGSSTT